MISRVATQAELPFKNALVFEQLQLCMLLLLLLIALQIIALLLLPSGLKS